MQRPDERKRELITATAARMFATRPYHEVRLDDIAAAARIGKGTLYIYFDNKEDLYFSLIYDGFARLVDRLRERLGAGTGVGDTNGAASPLTASETLERIVRELVAFAFAHPHFFELMRSVGKVKGQSEADWNRKREEFRSLVEGTIRRGIDRGELTDPHPELTALCIGGMVRSVMLFGPKGIGEDEVASQIFRLLSRGIVNEEVRHEMKGDRRDKRGTR
jgi:AcrR family transcriptional regulator